MTKPIRKSREEILRARRILDLQAVDLPAELVTLKTGQDIEIIRAGEIRGGKKVDNDVARRLDVFMQIKLGEGPEECKARLAAVRRLEADLSVWMGEDDRGPRIAVVDESRKDRGDFMDRRLEAHDRVASVLIRCGGRDSKLLTELIRPGIPGEHWRCTVTRVTSETNPVAQATVIRAACANLAAAYCEIDGGK